MVTVPTRAAIGLLRHRFQHAPSAIPAIRQGCCCPTVRSLCSTRSSNRMKARMRRYMTPFGAAILTALLLAIGISPVPVGSQETKRPGVSAEILIEDRPGGACEEQAGRRRVPAEGRQAGRREHRRPGLPLRHDRAGTTELAGCHRPVPCDAGAHSRSAPGAARPGTGLFPGGRGRQRGLSLPSGAGRQGPARHRACEGAFRFSTGFRRRKAWSVTGSVAIVPDNNINAATSAKLVDLLRTAGAPFRGCAANQQRRA